MTKISWPTILNKNGLVIHYRACSEGDAWRKPPKHKTLKNALFGEFGVRELFRKGSKLNTERTRSYGAPYFAAVWIENESWALLIKERVVAIIPVSNVTQFDPPPRISAAKRKSADYVAQVQQQLSRYFDDATVYLLLDEQEFSQVTNFELRIRSLRGDETRNADSASNSENTNSLIAADLSDEEAIDELEKYHLQLAEEVDKAIADKGNRKARLINAQVMPEKFIVQATVFRRSPDVIAEVLERSNGVCENCGADAPFLRLSNGQPYLEVHHKVPLSKGGDDSVENALALCPNCHRRQHYGQT